MKVKNFILKAMLFASVAAIGFSCSDDNDNYDYYGDVSNTNGAYILNEGGMGHNNATLSYYNIDSATVSNNVFQAQNNGLNLGDTGNDMLIYGSKMYIVMTGSKCIYVTDRNAKRESTIISTKNSATQQPRYLTASGKYVYVTYSDGYVARIDTTNTSEIKDEVQVGSYPEELTVSNGKIYVANSGYGSGSTVSVIDIPSFTVTKTINVVLNPTKVTADGNGNVFLISMGDYGTTISNTLQRINSDYSVDSLANATYMSLSKDSKSLYCIYAQWGVTNITYKTYNISAKEFEASPFVSSTVAAGFSADPYSINVNPKNGYVYIGVSDYISEGKMYIINPSTGSLVSSFFTGGISPHGAYFLVK